MVAAGACLFPLFSLPDCVCLRGENQLGKKEAWQRLPHRTGCGTGGESGYGYVTGLPTCGITAPLPT